MLPFRCHGEPSSIELPEDPEPDGFARVRHVALMLSRIPRLQQHLDLQFLRCRPSNGLW